MNNLFKLAFFILLIVGCGKINAQQKEQANKPTSPNILFCIADDASFQYLDAYRATKWIETPAIDRVAREGLLFMNAYTPTAKCSPSRSAILTGRNPWQLEAAGNHNPVFPKKFRSFMEVLKKQGYFTGFTGKGWAPGDSGKLDGQPRQLTGKPYNNIKTKAPARGISPVDYVANFREFLQDKPREQPFCFWYGGHEPHRRYEYGSGKKKGKKQITDIDTVPPFWIDNETVRNDMLDYAYEVEYFDKHLGKILETLEKTGELENTLIIVTSDNGMPFPRVKGHVYEFDNHLPLAIMWKGHIKNPGRKIRDYLSFIDFAPTFLEVAGIAEKDTQMQPIQGNSFLDILNSANNPLTDNSRDHVLIGREREDVGRPEDKGYPVRGIVEGNFVYTKNYEPERWPSGNPETGYMDTDGSPTKTEILKAHRMGSFITQWELCFGKRPAEELYRIDKDPYCLVNLADDPEYSKVLQNLRAKMETELKEQQDPRMFGKGYLFDNYPYGNKKMRNFYERYMKGEKIHAGWINKSDFEEKSFE